ncbi:MAG: hypothetical protein ACREYE_06700 [Gammaproteobacteria bacterium]
MVSLLPNTRVAIKLQPAERTPLETGGSAHGTPQQMALRCRIILGALEPKSQALHLDGHRRGHHQEDRAGAGQNGADQAQIHPASREKRRRLNCKVI